MATYLYQCRDCGHRFEKVMTIREHEGANQAARCPKCQSRNVVQRPTTFQAVTASKA